LQLLGLRPFEIFGVKIALDFERASHRLDRAGKKRHQAVAGRFQDLAANASGVTAPSSGL
jgi:hypothetical protein